jgi:hypothetical protein
MDIAERVNPSDNQGFLRWTGQNPDWRDYTVGMLQSIFPRAFKAVQEPDISVYIKDGKAHLHHDVAESFTVSRFSRPAMWMTQSVMRLGHVEAFKTKVMASKGWWELTDNPASNHFMNWAISKYDDAKHHGLSRGMGTETSSVAGVENRTRTWHTLCVVVVTGMDGDS